MKLNFYAGYYNTVNHFLNYKNPILNYFKDIYNDCFVPSFMNNNTDELCRNKHAGAHIMVKSFTPRDNGFKDYHQNEYYYVTNSQVNIVNHYYFNISKNVVNNSNSTNKFMFLTSNSLFVCDKDFIIQFSEDINYETNIINRECYFIPVEACETIPFKAEQYFGFYNTAQWKPRSIGFYNGKVAGNEFKLIFPNLTISFNSVNECYRWIQENEHLTYTKSSKQLGRDIKKGEVVFAEGSAKVEWICGKYERNTEYETVHKRVIREYVEEQEKNKKEFKEFERQTSEELNKTKTHSVKSVTKNNSETQNVSRVIIKSNIIYSNIYRFNNNTGHPASQSIQAVVLDNNIESWEDFVNSKEICNFYGRRPKIADWIKYTKSREAV